jgi:hypothetical protein
MAGSTSSPPKSSTTATTDGAHAKHEPSVAVYPDSDKIGVWPGDRRDHVLVRRESGVDYWDGEV